MPGFMFQPTEAKDSISPLHDNLTYKAGKVDMKYIHYRVYINK